MLARLFARTIEVSAHCDLPCGVYDPAHLRGVVHAAGQVAVGGHLDAAGEQSSQHGWSFL